MFLDPCFWPGEVQSTVQVLGSCCEPAGPDPGQGTHSGLVFLESVFVSLASTNHGAKLMVRVVFLFSGVRSPYSEPPSYITLTHQASIPPALNQPRVGDQTTGDSSLPQVCWNSSNQPILSCSPALLCCGPGFCLNSSFCLRSNSWYVPRWPCVGWRAPCSWEMQVINVFFQRHWSLLLSLSHFHKSKSCGIIETISYILLTKDWFWRMESLTLGACMRLKKLPRVHWVLGK